MSNYNTSYNSGSNSNSNNSGSDVISGVDCNVPGCKYHHPGGQCSASNIKVEAPNASDKMDTYCGSFAACESDSQSSSATNSVSDSAVFGGESSVYGSNGAF
ncbi:MAG: DUF1540 domain-containing protein [Oscillospiraceae bacterium]|jgi:hypothetical protein|nr:DUF1540 domain-containing protein [Oscillospiraceae bacterium]